jgi:hypothetical protein
MTEPETFLTLINHNQDSTKRQFKSTHLFLSLKLSKFMQHTQKMLQISATLSKLNNRLERSTARFPKINKFQDGTCLGKRSCQPFQQHQRWAHIKLLNSTGNQTLGRHASKSSAKIIKKMIKLQGRLADNQKHGIVLNFAICFMALLNQNWLKNKVSRK